MDKKRQHEDEAEAQPDRTKAVAPEAASSGGTSTDDGGAPSTAKKPRQTGADFDANAVLAEAFKSQAQQFTCDICLELPEKPVTTPCGHNHCQTCLQAMFDKRTVGDAGAKCPTCREVFMKVPSENKVLTGLIDAFLVSSGQKDEINRRLHAAVKAVDVSRVKQLLSIGGDPIRACWRPPNLMRPMAWRKRTT